MDIQLTYHRRHTTTTKVGKLEIGSEHPVRIQTMANTSTNDIEGCVAQAQRCIGAGTELLRFTTQGMREVESLTQIHGELFKSVPLVADVHFQSDVADEEVDWDEELVNEDELCEDECIGCNGCDGTNCDQCKPDCLGCEGCRDSE